MMAASGPSLKFDPRYVNFMVEAWQERSFAPIEEVELKEIARVKAEDTLIAYTAMGFPAEMVSDPNISSSYTLLKSLKLIKEASSGPKGAKIKKLVPSPVGQQAFSSQEVIGWISLPIVKLLTTQNTDLKNFLQILEEAPPLELPILRPTPLAPKKKEAAQKLLQTGLIEFGRKWHQEQQMEQIFLAKIPQAKAVKQALDIAIAQHPLKKIASLETLLSIAEQLGLIWTDTQQINAVLALKTIGCAAVLQDGVYVPHIPKWEEIESQFFKELMQLGTARADQSGFVTVEALRGGLGRAFHISPQIVDMLLCKAREETDKAGGPLQLFFDENEEAINAKGRHPLIWEGRTYDFVVVAARMPQAVSQSEAVIIK